MPDGGERREGDQIFSSRSNSGLFGDLLPRPELHEHPLTVRLEDAIDWEAALAHERRCKEAKMETASREYYVVVFRSQRLDTADDEQLYAADSLAHEEALASGGLLGYWYGILNERRECLAMCIWESREQAVAALRLQAHKAASSLTQSMYKQYALERYWLRAGSDGVPIITPLSSIPISV